MALDTVTIPPSSEVRGAIVWPKASGRPDATHLHHGFSIVIEGADTAGTASGGPIFDPGFGLVPKVVDGDGGPENWRVEFSRDRLNSVEELTKAAIKLGAISPAKAAEIVRRSTYRITILRRPDVNWTRAEPAAIKPLRVDPQALIFRKEVELLLVLPDFGISDSLI